MVYRLSVRGIWLVVLLRKSMSAMILARMVATMMAILIVMVMKVEMTMVMMTTRMGIVRLVTIVMMGL